MFLGGPTIEGVRGRGRRGDLFVPPVRSYCARDQQAEKNNSGHNGIGEHQRVDIREVITEVEVGEGKVLQGEESQCEGKED